MDRFDSFTVTFLDSKMGPWYPDSPKSPDKI